MEKTKNVVGKKVPSRTVSSVSDADERDVGGCAERRYAEEERAVWNADCLEDEERTFRWRRRKEAGESQKVGEHSRAANVECLCRGFSFAPACEHVACERV